MATQAPGALKDAESPACRAGLHLIAAGWWTLAALVTWACFLRPPPRSLALTLQWFQQHPWIAVACAAAMLSGAALQWRRSPTLCSLSGLCAVGLLALVGLPLWRGL